MSQEPQLNKRVMHFGYYMQIFYDLEVNRVALNTRNNTKAL